MVHAVDVGLVASGLGTDPQHGLTTEEAAARLARHGPNELEAGEQLSAGRILLGQVTSPMVVLLAAAAILSAALGDVTEATFIFFVVVLNAWIGFRQEYRAEQAMASLQALATPTVKVLRQGVTQEIAARELVPGDIVLLDAGSRVPADGRLVEAHALRVEEAALTGESVPVDKRVEPVDESTPLAERTSMAYAGTSVTAGRGTLVVTSTGMGSELGRIADLLGGAEPGRTPLQQRLDTLVRGLALLAGVIVLVVFGIGLLRGEELDELLLTAVSLAVAAIPESLPAVVTITLALGAQRMLAEQRPDPAAVRGRDAWVGHDDLLGQDRDADPEPDDGCGAGHGRRPPRASRSTAHVEPRDAPRSAHVAPPARRRRAVQRHPGRRRRLTDR